MAIQRLIYRLALVFAAAGAIWQFDSARAVRWSALLLVKRGCRCG